MDTDIPEKHVIPGQEDVYQELQTFLRMRRAERKAQRDDEPTETIIKLVPAQEIARRQRINIPQYRVEHVHSD